MWIAAPYSSWAIASAGVEQHSADVQHRNDGNNTNLSS